MCEVLVDHQKNLFMSLKPSNAFQMIMRSKKSKQSAERQICSKKSSATMSRVNSSDVPPPVSLDTHPLRSISKKPALHKSTPDLAKIGSNNSSTESLTVVSQQRRSHYSSHEDVAGVPVDGKVYPASSNARSTVDPSSRYEWNEAFTTQTIDPSTRYEWSEPSVQSKPKSSGEVSEGYCRLNIFNDKVQPSLQRPASCGDYSVLNLPEPYASPRNETNVTNSHNYFTLEVLDDPGSNSGSNSPQMINEDPPESEGVYFTLEETSPSSFHRQQPQPNGSTNGVRSTAVSTSPTTRNHRTAISSGYSYVELDTDDKGKSPPVVTAPVRHKNKGKPLLPSRSAGHLPKENTYDTLRQDTYDTLKHGFMKPPRSARSVSQSDYRSLSYRSSSPRVSGHHHVQPNSIRQTISPPTLPYHKKDFSRIHSCPNNTRSGEPNRMTLVRSHSPKSPLATTTVIHDYDEVEIDDGSDDDVPISLPSPTSPNGLPPIVDERESNSPSHDSMVQLIITDEGPLLVPRKRSLTADASNLRQFRNQQHSNSRPSSLSRQHQHHQHQQRAMSAFANK